MIRIAIIGCGNIASALAEAIDKNIVKNALVIGLYDYYIDKCTKLVKTLSSQKPRIVASIDDLLSLNPDLVIEAASQEAVKAYGIKIIESGCDLIVMSVGALMDKTLLHNLLRAARRRNKRIYVPSGAIAGLDAIYALSFDDIIEVKLTTRKPPSSLIEAPYVKNKSINLKRLRKAYKLYEGPASQAVKHFPANINIAASLSLAAGKEAMVEVFADPAVRSNIHEIYVKTKVSTVKIIVENIPSPRNPKTSYLAVLSAISLLKRIADDKLWIV